VSSQIEKPVYRVWGWDSKRLVWTLRSSHDDGIEAAEHAEALQHRNPRLRVMITPNTTKLLVVKPPINSEFRAWRQQIAGQMSDLADAKKKYKSPG
jgi:hypothetical protein